MNKLKPLDHKILSELMKNARISDRQMAKILGVSQPTVSRRRVALEREVIDGYTAIPKWNKLGYELCAMTFINSEVIYESDEKRKAALKKAADWMRKQPNVIVACRGRGMAGFMVLLHKDYSDFEDFISRHNSALGQFITESQSFLTGVDKLGEIKAFHLKYLAEAK